MTDDQLKEIVSRLWNEKYNGNPSYRVSLFKKAAEEVLLSAMREAARLESIGFSEWVKKWYVIKKGRYIHKGDFYNNDKRNFTTEQLYNEFLNQSK